MMKLKERTKDILKKILTKKNIIAVMVIALPVIGVSASPETQAMLAEHVSGLLQMIIDAMPVAAEVDAVVAPTVG